MRALLAAALALLLAPAAALAQGSPSPYTSATRYDAMGRATGTISADPDTIGAGNPFLAVRTTYDPAGRPTRVETGRLATWQSEAVAPANWGASFSVDRTLETQYDVMGRKVREQLREGDVGPVRTLTQYSYDALGRLECTAVRMNPAVFGSPPASACTLGTQGSQGPDRITRNVYDAAGQRLQLREGVGSDVEAAEASWAYNANGQVTTVIDGNGNRAELRYDGHGRQDRWTFPSTAGPASYNDATPASALASAGSANPNDYESYGYDANGNRISLRKRDGSTLTYTFDALNRMIAKIVPERTNLTAGQTRDVHYGYDLRGLQLSARFDSPAGEGVANAYDGFGRLASSSTDMGGVARTLAYAHDRNGNRIAITYPDGVIVTLDHDGIDRPYFLSSSLACCLLHMAYHPNGAPLASSRPDGSWSWLTYDGLQRLASLAHHFPGGASDVLWSFGRNAAGQLASTARDNDAYAWTGHYAVNRAYVVNGLNQYTAAGLATFGYDLNGNLTSDGTNTYRYDIENRMVLGPNGASLVYDPLGRLFQVNGTTPLPTVIRFLYDGDALVAEYDGSNEMRRRHLHWPGADVPVTTWEGAGFNPRQLHADERGSIVAVDNMNGVPTINTYDEWGIPGAGNVGRFQYTGQIWLPELGMYYYKARIYSPTLGRFLQMDPIGYDDQFNLYAYVGNDPVNLTDPDGRQVEARVIWNALPAPWRANILEGLADVVEVGGVAWDIATLPTIVGSGPEGIAATQAASAGIRAAARQEARAAARAGRNAPNPHGSRGAPDHQADVLGPGQRQAERQARPGEEVRTERGVVGHPGVNRRPDNQIVGRDGRTRLVVESERRPNSARNRERVEQYRRCGIECQTRPLPPRPRNGQ